MVAVSKETDLFLEHETTKHLQTAEFVEQKTEWIKQLEQVKQEQIYTEDRLYWLLQLRENFDQHEYDLTYYQLMLDLAERLCDWVMVIDIAYAIQHRESFDLKDEEASELICLTAEGYFQLGYYITALNLYKSALLRFYQNKRLFNGYQWLLGKEETTRSSGFPLDYSEHEYSRELHLTPLEPHHIDAFRWLYSKQSRNTKSVAELCNLPHFENDQHWFDWQANNLKQGNYYVYAIIHQEWGFIGSVCLEVYHGVGFFYYWLGQDFQGHGFGPKAVSILLSMGVEQKAMHSCYAKVYETNHHSQKAIEKLGFTPLSFRQIAPDDNEILYYLGPEKGEQDCAEELETLYRDMGSSIELDIKKEVLDFWVG